MRFTLIIIAVIATFACLIYLGATADGVVLEEAQHLLVRVTERDHPCNKCHGDYEVQVQEIQRGTSPKAGVEVGVDLRVFSRDTV
jgi:hypothetical protein